MLEEVQQMDRSDINWNTKIRVDSLLRTRIKKKIKSFFDLAWFAISSFFRIIFSKEFLDVILCMLLLVIIIGVLGFMISYPIIHIRHINQIEKERAAEETRLKSSGWICINSSDKVSAELLARKRSDAIFGTDNYLFQATNVVTHRFWYLASPKTNSIESSTQGR